VDKLIYPQIYQVSGLLDKKFGAPTILVEQGINHIERYGTWCFGLCSLCFYVVQHKICQSTACFLCLKTLDMVKKFSNRVFIDTNVFLYGIFYRNFSENEAYEKQGRQADFALKHLKKQAHVTLYVASFTLVQILSTLSHHRYFPNQQTATEITQIIENYEVIDFTQTDTIEAIALNAPDLEDAFQYTLSQKLRCAYILSENTRDFNQFQNIQVFKPKKVRFMMF